MFNLIYRYYKDRFYDKLIEEFVGVVPTIDREPVLEFLADRRVLFERFLSIQAYHIQKARINSKKSQDFYDGALMIIRAFLSAVNKRVVDRTTFIPKVDDNKQTEDELGRVSSFLKAAKEVIHT